MGLDAKDLKLMLGDQAKEIILGGLPGVEYDHRKEKGLCPFHNEKTPSFGWNNRPGEYFFKCFGCNETLDIYRFYTEFQGMTFKEAKQEVAKLLNVTDDTPKPTNIVYKNEFSKPKYNSKPCGEGIAKHLAERGLTKATLDFWRIEETIYTMNKGKENEEKVKMMMFNCYNEFDELEHSTLRASDKRIVQSSNTKAILWGMWHIKDFKTLVICEGQIDAMSIWQSGFKSVVSVPAGCANRRWIEYNYEWLSKFKEIVFWSDHDTVGRDLAKEVKARLKNVTIVVSDDFKDANEMMMKKGAEAVLKFVDTSKVTPDGIVDMSEILYDTEPASDEQRIETGFCDYDRHINDWRLEQLTVVFGRDNEGKSTFISQVVAHQLQKRKKTFLYSAELGEQNIQDWLYRQIVGDEKKCYERKRDKYNESFYLKHNVVKAVKMWHKDLLFVVNRNVNEIVQNQDLLFDSMRTLAVKFGVKLFIIDNLQAALEENADSLYSDQSNFTERCRQFAINHKVHVVLVCHPRKVEELIIDKDSKEAVKFGNLKKTDISGSKNISNKAHNIISIERDFDGVHFDMILTNLKDKHQGVRKGFTYRFSTNSFRFFNNYVDENVKYDWNKYLTPDVRPEFVVSPECPF